MEKESFWEDFSEEEVWSTCEAEVSAAADVNGSSGQLRRGPGSGLTSALPEENEREKEGAKRVVHRLRNAEVRGRRRGAAAVRIMRVESAGSLHAFHDGESEGEEEGWVPPHEYLARSARSMSTRSVVEGAGRTLKGRDMRRVRDAVWSQTGFFG